MARTIETTVPADMTDELVKELRHIPGLMGLRVQRGISIEPPGDTITVQTTNASLHPVMQLLQNSGVGSKEGTSITTSEPVSAISSSLIAALTRDPSDATWEEMEIILGKESNMTANKLLLMASSGFLAAIGLYSNALHLILAASVIAPGFNPLTRMALGLVAQGQAWRQGIADTFKGYGALLIGAVVAALVLWFLGKPVLGQEASSQPADVLTTYWTTLSATSLLASSFASVAGAVLVATNRAELTAGALMALSLIPSATVVGMALVVGDFTTMGHALLRWFIDAGLVLSLSLLVLLWKRSSVQKRKMML